MANEFHTALAEAFSARNMAAYYDTAQENAPPSLGETLFPPRKTVGLDIKYVKGKAGAPVVLRPAAFDTAAAVRGRIAFQAITNEMAFWREALVVGERDRQELLKAAAHGDAYLETMLGGVYNDTYQLVLGANAAVERMRLKLLATGAIQFTADGVPYDYSYGFDPAQQAVTLTGPAAWNQPETADPLGDLLAAMDAAGLSEARAIMSAGTFRRLAACTRVKEALFGADQAPAFVSHQQILTYVQDALRLTLVVIGNEENTYRERLLGEELRMFPDGVVSVIPATGFLGETFYGTTPEEADLMLSSAANVQIVGTGVAIATHVTPTAPVQLSTTVSQIALPSCERIERLYILNVYAA